MEKDMNDFVDKEKLRKALRDYIKHHELSITQTSQRIGLDVWGHTLSHFLKGKHKTRLTTMLKILNFLEDEHAIGRGLQSASLFNDDDIFA